MQIKNGQRRISDAARAALTSAKQSWPELELGHLCAATLASFSHSELQAIEREIGLQRPDPEFRTAIADAIVFCACVHAVPSKRYADIRKELTGIQKRAAAAASAVAALRDALHTAAMGEALKKHAPSLNDAEFKELGARAGRAAAALVGKDKGGRPQMRAFDGLVRLLADAFSRATGDRATITWHEHHRQYEGRFWTLVEAVLPKAAAFAALSGRPLAQPNSPTARGKFIQRHTFGSMDKTDPSGH
jgi:hypothetical protein